MPLRYVDVAIEPSTAMPSAPPSSRDVSLTAEPTPARLSGTDDMIAPVAGAAVMPIDPPSTINPARISQYDESGSRSENRMKPTVMPQKPVTTIAFRPNRSPSLALRGATRISMNANGISANPASSGE